MTPWTIAFAAPGALLFVLFLLFPVHYPALARTINSWNSTNSKGRSRAVHSRRDDCLASPGAGPSP